MTRPSAIAKQQLLRAVVSWKGFSATKRWIKLKLSRPLLSIWPCEDKSVYREGPDFFFVHLSNSHLSLYISLRILPGWKLFGRTITFWACYPSRAQSSRTLATTPVFLGRPTTQTPSGLMWWMVSVWKQIMVGRLVCLLAPITAPDGTKCQT